MLCQNVNLFNCECAITHIYFGGCFETLFLQAREYFVRIIFKVGKGTAVEGNNSGTTDMDSLSPASQSLLFVNGTLLRMLRMVVGLEKSVKGQEIIELGIPSLVARAATGFSSLAHEARLLGIQVLAEAVKTNLL